MKCVIVDDEPLAIRLLTRYIEQTEGLELLRSFENAFEALYYVQTKPVELVFLDIRMPEINGLQFIKILKYPPRIVITTAFREYALEAMEIGVVDYLLKPLSYERFLGAVSKAFESHSPPGNQGATAVPDLPSEKFFYVKSGGLYERIWYDEVLFVQADRNLSRLFTARQTYDLGAHLAYYQLKLPPDRFARVHKSYLVALSKIDRFSRHSLWIGEREIPIGKTYQKPVLSYLESKKI